MKNKKLRFIIMSALILVLAAATTITLVCCNNCKSNNDKDQVTVTFETNGGNKVSPITLNKGEKIEDLPKSYLAGSSFDGWYTDQALENEFIVDTEINNDMTLYAGFTKTNVDLDVTETTNHYAENVNNDHAIKIIADKAYSSNDFLKAITITAVTGFLPWNETDELAEELPKDILGWLDVSQDGLVYTIKPKPISFNGGTVYAYEDGQLYQIEIPRTMHFEGLEPSVTQYSFRIGSTNKSADVNNVQYKDIKNLRYVKKAEINNLNEITEIVDGVEEITTDTNGYYNFFFNETVFDNYDFKKDNILCIGDGKELNVDSLFVKVVEVIKKPGNGEIDCLVLAVDADIEEVFNKIDVNYNNVISSDDILENLDLETMKEEIKSNGSLEQVTDLMSKLLLVSDEVQEAYGFTSQDIQKLEGTNPGIGLPDFCYNTEIKNEATLLKFKMLEDAEVKISAGKGHNPNFDSAYTDEFVALRITFSYEATIKNKLEIQASITFTQYLAASAQGYLEYDMGIFKLKWAEFDFAVNLYSQTDIDFKILVRTVKQNGADKGNDNNNGDDKKEGFKDIAEKIAEKLKSDEGDDPDNLVAELNEMLSARDTEIELFRAPILNIPIDIIPGIPVMQINVELDFLVTMRFAAGFNAHVSVLEAIQVGVTGSTKTKSIKSYKHDNLLGGNQYALQLSACGYLGFKAGFEGGISVSFCGLSSLGRVGIWVYAGAYIDIYGFAQATLVKQNNIVSQSLVGGYYIEIGVFVEVKLEARSKLFNTSVGVKLVDEKWPLVKFGNKEVLVSVEKKELEEEIYIANNGENEASIKLDSLPKLNGVYIDITTGETYTKEVPWNKVTLRTSSYSFKYNPSNQTIDYTNYESWKPASETCIATYYFNGPILQFNMSATQYKDLCPFASTKIIYYDASKMEKENVGKEVSVKFYSLVDGKKELMDEYKVLAGTPIKDAPKLDPYKYENRTWNMVPWETVVTTDTEFICTAELRQVYIAFIYYDPVKDAWITEIRACNIGETPIAPVVPDGNKIHHAGWEGKNGINNRANNTPSAGIGQTITVDDMWKRGYFIESTTGKPVDEAVVTYSYQGYQSPNLTMDIIDETHTSEQGTVWYNAVASYYIATYNFDECVITVNSTDDKGVYHVDKFNIPFNRQPTTFYTYSPLTLDFKGFAFEEGGEIVYETLFEIEHVRDDMVLYAIYEKLYHDINLYYYDIVSHEYQLYKTVKLAGGSSFTEIEDDFEYIKNLSLTKEEGVESEFVQFIDRRNDIVTTVPVNSICARPGNVYPQIKRTVDIVFDSGDGIFTNKDEDGNYPTKVEYFTKSILDYELTMKLFCAIPFSHPIYCYEFIGWKNSVTGEEILFDDPSEYTLETTCDVPTTFVAIYKKVERRDYNITIETPYSTLKDGSKKIEKKNITYEEYNKIFNDYYEWNPDNYRDDDNHCTYVHKGKTTFACQDGYIDTIIYMFEKTIDRHKVYVDVNGGKSDDVIINVYENIEWNNEIDLADYVLTRVDDYGTWKMVNWTDSAGNTYELNSKYLVRGDDTLTLNWEIVEYKEYTITFRVDYKDYEVKKFHKDDVLEEFGKPSVADGKIFTGWTWYNSKNEEIEALTEMPSENLRLIGYTSSAYVRYYLDGAEISNYEGRVGYEETVKEQYVKEGYTVSNWESADVTVNNSKFVMPEKDVIFNATSTVNSYTVTYYHNGEVYGDVKTVEFGTHVQHPALPVEDGKYFAWSSSDVNLSEIGFTMPAKNVEVYSISALIKQYIMYYVNDEMVGYQLGIPGQEFELLNVVEFTKYNDYEFSGWYNGKTALTSDSTIKVGEDITYVYGYFTKGSVKVNIYFDEENTSPDIVLYGNENDALDISMMLLDEQIAGYKVGETVTNEITITGNTEMNVYVQYESKKYNVSYVAYSFVVPDTKAYVKGEKVFVEDIPSSDETWTADKWFNADVEILTDENGKQYFIMPDRDVVINLISHLTSSGEPMEGYLTASVYIESPHHTEPIFYKDYIIDNNDGPVYFDVPEIVGYELIGFICNTEGIKSCNDHSGLKLDDMKGENRIFYAKYRKLERHVAEFRINNQVVGYREFYDSYEVVIDTPVVTLNEGEAFTGWKNLYLKPMTTMNTLLFYTGERDTHEYTGMDFVFNGYIYNTENSILTNIIYPEATYESSYEIDVNAGSVIRLKSTHNDAQIEYELLVNYNAGVDVQQESFIIDAIEKQGDEYVITIPTVEKIIELFGEDATINYFDIKAKYVNNDSIM